MLKLLAPFAPHLTEELWRGVLGHQSSIHRERWPKYDPRRLQESTFALVVQVNGKTRATLDAPVGASEKDALALALADPRIKKLTAGKKPRRVIFVPGRLINLVL